MFNKIKVNAENALKFDAYKWYTNEDSVRSHAIKAFVDDACGVKAVTLISCVFEPICIITKHIQNLN